LGKGKKKEKRLKKKRLNVKLEHYMTISHAFPHEDSTFIYILVHHMHGTIKKKIL